MGLFSDLKNMITGGGATVTLEVIEPALEAPFTVRVQADIGDADCAIKRVYLQLCGTETVEVPDVEVAKRQGEATIIERETVRTSVTTADFTVDLAPADTLKANQRYTWESEITLPPDCLPTYRGRLATHGWQIKAGLDMRGNDPDSGWQEIELY